MKRTTLALVCLVALTTACVKPVMFHPVNRIDPKRNFEQDKYECSVKFRQMYGTDLAATLALGKEEITRCLVANGWDPQKP